MPGQTGPRRLRLAGGCRPVARLFHRWRANREGLFEQCAGLLRRHVRRREAPVGVRRRGRFEARLDRLGIGGGSDRLTRGSVGERRRQIGRREARQPRRFDIAGGLPEGGKDEEEITVAGRVVSRRHQGKTLFAHLHDGDGELQLYIRRDDLGDEAYEQALKLFDLGDFKCPTTGNL